MSDRCARQRDEHAQRPKGVREHHGLVVQCGLPCGCRGAAEDEAREASLHAVEHLLYPHGFLPILVTDSLLTLIPALSIWHLAHDA